MKSGETISNVTGVPDSALRRVSVVTFLLFQVYQIDFFLRISNRLDLTAIRPTLLLFALTAITLLLQKDKLDGRFRHPITRAMNRFLFVIVITLPLVEWPGSVVRFHVPQFVQAIVFLYFTVLILDTHKRLKWYLFIFVACQVVRVVEPLYLNLTQDYWGDTTHLGGGEFANRLSGAPVDVINPNELGFVVVTIIPFLHYLLFTGGWLKKSIYLFLLPPLFYALILTMSRGAFLALLVVGFVIFRESRRKLLLVLVALGVTLAGWTVMDENQRDRYLSLVSDDSAQASTAEGRIDGIFKEFKLGFRRPIVGHGLGTTPEAKTHAGMGQQASHNMYAEVMIELGIVGIALFLYFIRQIYRQISFSRNYLLDHAGDAFENNLFKVFKVVFWMFALYSINYWGLSQYYWYNLAGLVVAASVLTRTQMLNIKGKPLKS